MKINNKLTKIINTESINYKDQKCTQYHIPTLI